MNITYAIEHELDILVLINRIIKNQASKKRTKNMITSSINLSYKQAPTNKSTANHLSKDKNPNTILKDWMISVASYCTI